MSWLAILVALLFAGPAAAAICTDGVDCYCDCVMGPVVSPAGYKNSSCAAKLVPVDNFVLLCEDFEADELNGTTPLTSSAGSGAPDYGPWYDSGTGGGCTTAFRGCNSYWARKYEFGNAQCLWENGTPSPATHGVTCTAGGQGCAIMEWSLGSQAGAMTCMDIMSNGEFDDDKVGNAEPLIPGGGSGVLDGARVVAHRNPASIGASDADTAGPHGSKSWTSATELGIAQAYAFPSDIEDSGIIAVSWKPNEYSDGSNSYEYMNLGTNTNRNSADDLPIALFRWASNCPAAIASAVENEGEVYCQGDGIMVINPTQPDFIQSVDAPYGTWGCSRSWDEGIGTSDHRIRVWHNEKLVIDIDNIDGNQLTNQSIDKIIWNNYANANQEDTGGTTELAYRYEDNVHVRQGEPYTCSQIGFTTFTPPVGGAGTLNFDAATYSVTEGTGGTTNLVVTVARTGGTTGAVTATITTAQIVGGAGAYTDFIPDPVLVSFGNGVGGTTTRNIPITPDALDEINETLLLGLGSPTGGVAIGATDEAIGTLNDDDELPALSISDASALESTNHNFVVSLSPESGRTVTVLVNSANGTALAPSDYLPVISYLLTFTPGQTGQPVPVSVIPDSVPEADQYYTMSLSAESNATVADRDGTGGIFNDDDPAPTGGFNSTVIFGR